MSGARTDESVTQMMAMAIWFHNQTTRPTVQAIQAHFELTAVDARHYMRLYLRSVSESTWNRRYWVALKSGKVVEALIDDDALTAPQQLSDFLRSTEQRGLRVVRRVYTPDQEPKIARPERRGMLV